MIQLHERIQLHQKYYWKRRILPTIL